MPTRSIDTTAPFQGIKNTAKLTGLSQFFIREGCKNGTIPCIMAGREYRINVPLFIKQLEKQCVKKQ